MKGHCRIFIIAAGFALGLAQAELREFKDVKGRSLEAEFLTLVGDSASLRLATGKVVQVPLERLSKADREWIEKQAAGVLGLIKLPATPLYPVKDWNEKANAYESYFIDYTGKRAFPRRFKEIHPDGFAGYHGEFSVVRAPYYGVVNTKGEALFGVSKKIAEKIESGSDVAIFAAQFSGAEGAYYTYLRKDGKVIMRQKFAGARPFNSERAWVNLKAADLPGQESKNGNWALIDYKGEPLHLFENLKVEDFSEGRAAVAINENADRWRVIDIDAKVIAEGPFHKVHPFINGVAVADGQLIDLQGKTILKREDGFIIEDRFALSEDDAIIGRRVTRDRDVPRYAILRRSTGEFLADIPNELSVDSGFFNGFAKVRDSQTRKCGYLARDGQLVIKAEFSAAEPFRNGFAEVGVKTIHDKAVINTTGEVIWTETKRPELPPPPAEGEKKKDDEKKPEDQAKD